MPCVLFDIDGTLLDPPTAESRFIRYLLRNRHMGMQQIAQGLGFFLSNGLRYGRNTPRKNKAYLAGFDVAWIAGVAERFVTTEIIPGLRPGMEQRVKRHRASAHIVCLLSGTPDFIAAPLARHLGAEHWCATLCRQEGGRYLAGAPLHHPFGDAKVTLGGELCGRLGCRIEEATAYANSADDIPLLRKVCHAVAVTPDKALLREARSRRWELVDATAGRKPGHTLTASG
jgi:HAD superfamily phosphoserine phosphatase-like hydrolase